MVSIEIAGSTYLDFAGAKVSQDVQTSANIIVLGTPRGFEAPKVAMTIHSQGQNSGKVSQKVTTINYSFRNDTGGNCSVNFKDFWIGGAFWNDTSNLVGISRENQVFTLHRRLNLSRA
jgi:hypothetical protein